MTPDPREIAKRLTAAQRKVVLTNDRGFADHAKGKWFASNVRTARRIFDLGLIEQATHLAVPTPLGLAVRAVLMEEQHG